MPAKKILFIHHGEVPGGAPKSLLNLILALKQTNQYEIAVWCVNHRMAAYFAENAHIETRLFPYPCKFTGKWLIGWAWIGHLKHLKKFFKDISCWHKSVQHQKMLIKEHAPDLIHLNSAVLFTSAIAAYKAGIPVVWHIREVIQKKFIRSRISHYLFAKYASKIIAISEAEYQSIGSKAQTKARIIYNWVDDKFFHYNKAPLKQNTLGVPETSKVILSLGGLSWRKGAVFLLDIFPYLKEDIYLVFIGDKLPVIALHAYQKVLLKIEELLVKGKLKKHFLYYYIARISQKFKKINSQRIRVINYTHDIRPYILSSDLIIAAHTFPHSARSVFEAWSLRKPVATLQNSGADKIVSHNNTGYILKHSNYRSTAEQLSKLINSPNKLQYLANNGYEYARYYFNQDHNLKKIRVLYNEILKKPDV